MLNSKCKSVSLLILGAVFTLEWLVAVASGAPQLLSLSHDGTVLVRCDETDRFGSLEWSTDLNGDWMPSGWLNIDVEDGAVTVGLPLGLLPEPSFFRFVASSEKLQPSPGSAESIAEDQNWGTLTGNVWLVLPGWKPPSYPSDTAALVTTVCVFEETDAVVRWLGNPEKLHSFVLSPFVDSTQSSGREGVFSMRLPPGDYSVFVAVPGGGFYPYGVGESGSATPVRVEPNEETWIEIVVDYLIAPKL
jgi:hypothetical protein